MCAFAVPIKFVDTRNRREDDYLQAELVVLVAGELCNTVQDAFVIAVEQQARERLQRLSALKRITPVDITQLSIKVDTQKYFVIVVYFYFNRNSAPHVSE